MTTKTSFGAASGRGTMGKAIRTAGFTGKAMACLVLASSAMPASAADCTLSATGLAFPVSYDPVTLHSTGDLDGTSTVTLTCTRTQNAERVNFALSLSMGGSGTYTPRRMASGVNTLNYNLFTDATRSVIWGNGTGGTSLVSGSFNLNPGQPIQIQTRTVYGRIPRAQDAVIGAYLDSITVTLIF